MGYKTNKVNLDLNTELTTRFCPALQNFYLCLSHWKIHHLLNKTHCNVVLQINDVLLLICEMEMFEVMKNILIAGNMPRISKWGRKLTKRVWWWITPFTHVNYKKFITMTVCVILAQGPTMAICNFYLIKNH